MTSISVIMPVYNGAEFIEESIQSVLSQSARDFELIIVDDGSYDGTAEIIRDYEGRVRFIQQANRGPSAARNRGLEEAKGKYVAFLDADDVWDHRFLERTSTHLDQLNSNFVGVCSGWSYVDQNGATLEHTRKELSKSYGLTDLIFTNPFPIHAVLARIDVVKNVGGFDEKILAMEDWDLWLRMTTPGGFFHGIGSCLAGYRLHGASNSRNPDRMRGGRMLALEKLNTLDPLPDVIRENYRRAVGVAFLQCSVEQMAVGKFQEGWSDLSAAIRNCPELLLEDDLYYAVISTDQPIDKKETSKGIDFNLSEKRILEALNSLFSDPGIPKKETEAKAYSRAYWVLGRIAYGQGQVDTARRYYSLGRKFYPPSAYQPENILFGAKSVLNPKWIAEYRELKRKISHF
jgi:glycosyltransferase involved in cell wall biosynthesis